MCIKSAKKPKVPKVQPTPEAPAAMVSPEESSQADEIRKSNTRRSLRIDMGVASGGSGLNVPQG